MAVTARAVISPSETVAVLDRVDALLATLAKHIAHIALAGELTAEQTANLRFSLDVVDGLRTLFAQERLRHSGPSQAPRIKRES